MLVVALLAVATSEGASPSAAPQQGSTSAATVPGELLVRFRPGADGRDRSETRAAADVKLERPLALRGAQLLEVEPGQSVSDAVRELRRDPDVLYVEPNRRVELHAAPRDRYFGDLWGLSNTGQPVWGRPGKVGADIDALGGWEITTGSRDVKVAILDTGVEREHPDLAANMWTNPGEAGAKGNNGLDDDDNGFIDDWRGWDTFNQDNDPADGHGHGTHVAGTVGAVADNGVGVAGVAQNVSLIPVKALGNGGSGTTDSVSDALVYAGQIGAHVANASFGRSELSPFFEAAMRAAPNTLFVVSAGNNGRDNDAAPHSPCGEPVANVVCVAATDNTDGLSSFSNYGASSVDLGAPGENILSTTRDGGYGYESGSSMAAPHASGVAALLVAAHPGASLADIRERLLWGSDPVASLEGRTVTGARLDLRRALTLGPNTGPTARARVATVLPRAQASARLDASESSDADGFISEYRWDLDGDGSYELGSGSSPTRDHSFDAAGQHEVGVQVRDNRGAVASERLTVAIAPAPTGAPVAKLDGPGRAVVNAEVVFDGSDSTDDGPIEEYEWDLDGDTRYETSTGTTPTLARTYEYTETGEKWVGLRVRDSLGNRSETRMRVEVVMVRPTAEFTWSPAAPRIGDTITFDGTMSTSVTDINAWHWDFGDGDYAQGSRVTHRFKTSGLKRVTLNVYDYEDHTGYWNTVTKVVNVKAGWPIVAADPAQVTEEPGDSDGDGVVEPGEGIVVGQSLANRGPEPLTGVEAGLVSAEGDSVMPTGVSTWPDIPAGGSAEPTTRATADTYGTIRCGRSIDLELAIETDHGKATVPVTVPSTGTRGPTVSTPAVPSHVPMGIRPGYMGGVSFEVLETGGVKDVDVRLDDIRTADPGNLRIRLRPPLPADPINVPDKYQIIVDRPGGSGEDMIGTIIDDDAPVAIADGTPPFTGRFRPHLPMTNLIGREASGVWTLMVENWSKTATTTVNDVGLDTPLGACDDPRNEPPTATIEMDYSWPSNRYSIVFDASGSTDPDGRIAYYKWDLDDDGTYETRTEGPTARARYSSIGPATVGVMAVDDDRAADEARMEFYVRENMHPQPRTEFEQPVVAGQPTRFDGSKSFDPDGRIVEYKWLVGGQLPYIVGPSAIEHTFERPGPAGLQLGVTDDSGATHWNQVRLDVKPAPGTEPPGGDPPGGGDDPPPGGGDDDPPPGGGDDDPDDGAPSGEPEQQPATGPPAQFPHSPGSPLYPQPPGSPAPVLNEPLPPPTPKPVKPPQLSVLAPIGRPVSALRRGLPVDIRCSTKCRVTARLAIRRSIARRLRIAAKRDLHFVASASRKAGTSGEVTLRLKPKPRLARALMRFKRLKLALDVTATGSGGESKLAQWLTLGGEAR